MLDKLCLFLSVVLEIITAFTLYFMSKSEILLIFSSSISGDILTTIGTEVFNIFFLFQLDSVVHPVHFRYENFSNFQYLVKIY